MSHARVPQPPGRGWWRRLALALPIVTTVLVVAVVGALIIGEQQSQVEAAESADEIAADFTDEVAAFRDQLTVLIQSGRDGDAAELRLRLHERIQSPPALPVLDGQGAELSSAYRDAQYLEATMLDPYVELVDTLARVAEARTFIAAAEEALSLRIEDVIGTTTIGDAAVVTDAVIPAFEDARVRFESVPVPGGQEDLAEAVSAAVQNVVEQSRLLVSFAALGQNYSFTYGQQIAVVSEAVRVYGLGVDAELANAVDGALPG